MQPVVIGDRERGIAQFDRALNHLVWRRCAIQKRPTGMKMEFDVGGHRIKPLAASYKPLGVRKENLLAGFRTPSGL